MTPEQLAEVEQLRSELAELRAEVKRLKPRPERGAGWVSDGDTIVSGERAMTMLAELRAEVKRLRACFQRAVANYPQSVAMPAALSAWWRGVYEEFVATSQGSERC